MIHEQSGFFLIFILFIIYFIQKIWCRKFRLFFQNLWIFFCEKNTFDHKFFQFFVKILLGEKKNIFVIYLFISI
jgi:hypothetical protein